MHEAYVFNIHRYQVNYKSARRVLLCLLHVCFLV